ncbi:hypothetical protein [Luteimonas abyssi]|uniref:hypothetical protein n=1 Tax=Luteimonas abyssi TaxID=1247514 RepID=UPI000737BA36|nr:hypothetical protein [Luteimonas abyssi]
MNRSLPLALCLICLTAWGGGAGAGEPTPRTPELRAALQVGASSLLSGRQWWHLMAGAAAPASLATASGGTASSCHESVVVPGRARTTARDAGGDAADWRRAVREGAGRVRSDVAFRLMSMIPARSRL